MREFNIEVEDRIGVIRDVAKIIGESGANIKAISSEIHEGMGLLHIITESESVTRNALQRAGYKFQEDNIIKVSVPDQPGELAKCAGHLADAGVNVKAIYVLGRDGDNTEIAVTVDDVEKARQICYPGITHPF